MDQDQVDLFQSFISNKLILIFKLNGILTGGNDIDFASLLYASSIHHLTKLDKD